MTNLQKFWKALFTLKADVECTVSGNVNSQSDFDNNIAWNTGTDENDRAITTNTCPHSEITWTKVKEEMDKL